MYSAKENLSGFTVADPASFLLRLRFIQSKIPEDWWKHCLQTGVTRKSLWKQSRFVTALDRFQKAEHKICGVFPLEEGGVNPKELGIGASLWSFRARIMTLNFRHRCCCLHWVENTTQVSTYVYKQNTSSCAEILECLWKWGDARRNLPWAKREITFAVWLTLW